MNDEDKTSDTSRLDKADKHVFHRLRPSGGYRGLRSFQTTTIIYDATVMFCERFIDMRSRTRDQMVQAARSGRQNIAEGSRASATSSKTELRLVNVARASLDELLLDYEDFLRQRGHIQWAKDSDEALKVRQVARYLDGQADQYALYRHWLANDDPAVAANAIICIIHQANYLLDRQIQALERQFIKRGGYSEQLATARFQERTRSDRSGQLDRSDQSHQTDKKNNIQPPCCPRCGGAMVLRTANKGPLAGSQFWGCAKYPDCKGVVPI
jgi:four helix bundle suffix protein